MTTPELNGVVRSVQVGRSAPLPWQGGTVPSAIFKDEVAGRLPLGEDGLPGDEQADLTVHGGPDKAVCCYAVEYEAVWEELLGVTPPPGAFGENFSVEGLTEDKVHIGDEFTVGSVRVQVSQPRGPCFKLAARWGRRDLPGVMAKAGISGFYFRVLEPGEVGAGDTLTLVARHSRVTVAHVMRVTYVDRRDLDGLHAAMEVPELAQQWQDALVHIERRAMLGVPDLGGDE